MRGEDRQSGTLFSYVDREARIYRRHPLRLIRGIVHEVVGVMPSDFEAAYSPMGRPGIAPETLLRALLLQAFYTIRSDRRLMEQLNFNLLLRWFAGLEHDRVRFTHLTGMILRRGKARFARRCGASAKMGNAAKAQKHPAFGGVPRPFGCVVGLARCPASRCGPRLPEGPRNAIKWANLTRSCSREDN